MPADDPDARATGNRNPDDLDRAIHEFLNPSTESARPGEPNRVDLAGAELPGADLSGLDLSSADLSGANLTGADLTGTRLDGANLSSALLDEANLHQTSFVGATLAEASLDGANLSDVDFSNADLTDADLYGAEFQRVNFSGARLVRVRFGYATNVRGIEDAADLTGTDLSEMTEMLPATRVECREKGAIGVDGFPCPACAYWDGATSGLDPGCETCGATGMVDWDPDVERANRPLTCPWCDGRGWFSYPFNTWACGVCDGLGKAELWAIDQAAVVSHAGDDPWEGYLKSSIPSITEEGIDFSPQDFVEGRIANATFTDCSFQGVPFSEAELTDVAFVRCNMTGTDFSEAHLTRVKFEHTQLSESVWADVQSQDVELIGCETTDMEIEPEIRAQLTITSITS